MLRTMIAAGALALFAASGAYAQDKKPEPKATPQQQRMADCNKQAKQKTLKGEARKKFMSGCLKAKKPA